MGHLPSKFFLISSSGLDEGGVGTGYGAGVVGNDRCGAKVVMVGAAGEGKALLGGFCCAEKGKEERKILSAAFIQPSMHDASSLTLYMAEFCKPCAWADPRTNRSLAWSKIDFKSDAMTGSSWAYFCN